MTMTKERAFELIKKLPDDKVIFVINILEGMEGLYDSSKEGISESQQAYLELQKYRKEGALSGDYKAELAEAREAKYENLG